MATRLVLFELQDVHAEHREQSQCPGQDLPQWKRLLQSVVSYLITTILFKNYSVYLVMKILLNRVMFE